jgi:hypothetical protein
MGKKKNKWKRMFDPGSIKSKSHVIKTNKSLPKQTLTQILMDKEKYIRVSQTRENKINFPSLFQSLVKMENFDELYRLVESRKCSRFIGSLDSSVKICITHYRCGLENKDVINKSLPLILKWYLRDSYNICVHIPSTIHIYPINGLDEQKNVLFVTHDVIDAPLRLHHSTIRYTLKDLKHLYEKFNFITFFKPDAKYKNLESLPNF